MTQDNVSEYSFILLCAYDRYLNRFFDGNKLGDEYRNWTQFVRCCIVEFENSSKPLPPVDVFVDALVEMDSALDGLSCGEIEKEDLLRICRSFITNVN